MHSELKWSLDHGLMKPVGTGVFFNPFGSVPNPSSDSIAAFLRSSAGRPLDKPAPHAHPSCRGCGGGPGEADPGGWRSRRGPEPAESGGDVQHRRGEVEEEERSAGGTDGCCHHCERYFLHEAQ